MQPSTLLIILLLIAIPLLALVVYAFIIAPKPIGQPNEWNSIKLGMNPSDLKKCIGLFKTESGVITVKHKTLEGFWILIVFMDDTKNTVRQYNIEFYKNGETTSTYKITTAVNNT